MGKSNKELTAEIVEQYVQSWNSSPKTAPMKTDDLCECIKSVYQTLNELEKVQQ